MGTSCGWRPDQALTEVHEPHVFLQRPPHAQGPAPGCLDLPDQGLAHIGCPEGCGWGGGTLSMVEARAAPHFPGGLGWGLTGVEVHIHDGSDGVAGPQVPQADTSKVLLKVRVPEEVIQLRVESELGLREAAQAGLLGPPPAPTALLWVCPGKKASGWVGAATLAMAPHLPRSRCSWPSPQTARTWGRPSPACRTAPAPRPPRAPAHPGTPWWLRGREQ